MSDDEIISIAVKASLLNYIDNETPRRFFISGHAELEDVVNFGRVIAATAFEKGSNVMRAEVERLRAALRELHDEMDEYQRINNLSAYNNHVMRQARAALGEEKKG